MQEIYEKLGLFYLGKDVDKGSLEPTDALTLLKNKNLTTHAAIIGMTGSGKTGLGIGLIEEAAIDNVPVIVIDPKGDMGDLCLTDPSFSASRFQPWVEDEAEAKGEDPALYAQKVAKEWKAGIESWHQTTERVARLHHVPKTIYTPGSSAGVPINILASMAVPPQEIMEESDSFASYVKSTAVSLLSLINEDTQSLDSPQYILLAKLLTHTWLKGESTGIERLIGEIITPPFNKIGVLDLELFFPQDKRFAFASKFNALLASPSFSLWLQGESLDIDELLYDQEGRAKVAIFSIAHLNDEERMFFVTLLLNTYIAWMRRQSGTSRLRALLYMDEIFGFFPPSKNPPSKEPMLTLLKQARAFGIGIVLSTQNPVDLDYKGLSNIGTWFIGRLQTPQDIERVIDGLEGKTEDRGVREKLKMLLGTLPKRTFFLKSAHLDEVRLFTTRWVLSYLKGPLQKKEIAQLMEAQKHQESTAPTTQKVKKKSTRYQHIDPSIPQHYEPDPTLSNRYSASIGAKCKVRFYQQRRSIDLLVEKICYLPLDPDMEYLDWTNSYTEESDFSLYPKRAPEKVVQMELPSIVAKDKGLRSAIKGLKNHLYQTESITLWRVSKLKMESTLEESKKAFLIRLQAYLDEKKEEEISKLQERYEKKEKVLLNRLSRAKERVAKESADATSTLIETGIAVLSALFGKTSSAKIGRAVNKGGKILKERGEMSRAEERVAAIEEDIIALSDELDEKIDLLYEKYQVENYEISEVKIKPRKVDLDIGYAALVWQAEG